jgi:hypothetical protein
MSGVETPVSVRTRGLSGSGKVYDLSNDGCLVGASPGLITAGALVALNFASGIRLNGRAMLLHGSVARIEFDHPLHDAVVTHLTDSADVADGFPAHATNQRRRAL